MRDREKEAKARRAEILDEAADEQTASQKRTEKAEARRRARILKVKARLEIARAAGDTEAIREIRLELASLQRGR